MITKLDLGGLIAAHSDRDISESLTPISEAGSMRRTISGRLVDISNPGFRKYRLSISGRDLWSPAFDGIWPGMVIDIVPFSTLNHIKRRPAGGHLTEIRMDANGTSHEVIRVDLHKAPEGEITCLDSMGGNVPIIDRAGKTVYVKRHDGDIFIAYHPSLRMMIENWSADEVEREASVSWSLEAAEV